MPVLRSSDTNSRIAVSARVAGRAIEDSPCPIHTVHRRYGAPMTGYRETRLVADGVLSARRGSGTCPPRDGSPHGRGRCRSVVLRHGGEIVLAVVLPQCFVVPHDALLHIASVQSGAGSLTCRRVVTHTDKLLIFKVALFH